MNNFREKMAAHLYENLPLKRLTRNNELARASKFAFPDEKLKKLKSPDMKDSLEALLEKSKSPEKVAKREFGSSENIKSNVEKNCNQNGQKKASTSTMDDGYGSSNSTPQVSGKLLKSFIQNFSKLKLLANFCLQTNKSSNKFKKNKQWQ